jgi:NCS1 family nucleobase:cation symporter-1
MTETLIAPVEPIDLNGVSERYEAFVVEQRGIDAIPHADRNMTPKDLFLMWIGSLFNVETMINGAVIVSIGVSFIQAVVLILIGSVGYIAVGYASLQGPSAGTSTWAIARAPFGPRGGRLNGVISWVYIVGYEIEGVALISLVLLALGSKAGLAETTGLKVGAVILACALQVVMPLFGHATMVRVAKTIAYPLMAIFVVLAAFIAPKVNLGSISHGGGWVSLSIGLAISLSANPLGWITESNDYSRYLPATTSKAKVMWAATLGGAIPALLLEVLGAAVASAIKNATDPVSGLPHVLPTWLVVPYLILALPQLVAVNTLNLYSSGLILQAIGLKLRRWQAVLVDTSVCIVMGIVVVLSNSFNTDFSDFLQVTILWITPWAAIFLVDAFMRRDRYDTASLLDPRGGRYWGRNGFRSAAIVAELVGMAASATWIDATWFKGPLSSATNGADFSVFMGCIVGGVVYWVLARRQVKAETAALPGLALVGVSA